MLNYSSWKIFYLGKFLLRMCACFSEKVPKGDFINMNCPWRVILIDGVAICPGQMYVLEEGLSALPVGVSEDMHLSCPCPAPSAAITQRTDPFCQKEIPLL